MRNRLSIAAAIITLFGTSAAYAIDATMWENFLGIKVGLEKGMKATDRVALTIGDIAMKSKTTKIHYDKEKDIATAIFTPSFKDVNTFISSKSAKDKSTIYNYFYVFNEGSMLLLDILGRYGDICEVKTDENMGRTIQIVIKKDTTFKSDHPLQFFPYMLADKDYMVFMFISEDRVTVSKLMFAYVMKESEPAQ